MTKDEMPILTRTHFPGLAPSPTTSAGTGVFALQRFLLSEMDWCDTSRKLWAEMLNHGAKFLYVYIIEALLLPQCPIIAEGGISVQMQFKSVQIVLNHELQSSGLFWGAFFNQV